MKSAVLFLFLLVSLNVFGREWHINIKNSIPEIEIDNYPASSLNENEQVKLKGHFCLRKLTPPKKCQLLTPEELTSYDLKFFYPDITADVTQDVLVSYDKVQHNFEYQIPNVQKHQSPQFTVQLINKGSKILHYQKSLVKFQELIEKLQTRKDHCPKNSKRYADNAVNSLKKIEGRLLTLIRGETSVIAKRIFPIQIENNISKSSNWINAIEDWQLEMNFPLGNTFEGEKSWIDIVLTPYPTNDNQWKIEYYFDENLMQKKEILEIPRLIISERLLTPKLSAGLHVFKFRIYQRTSHLKLNKEWELSFEKKYTLQTFEDHIAPIWQDEIKEVITNKESLNFFAKISDSQGRIDLSTLNSILHLQNTGPEILLLDAIQEENVLIPDQHGNQEGASVISLTANKNLPEGIHSIQLSASDFAGNQVLTRNQQVIVDRTPPTIQVGSIPSLTKNSLLNLGITTFDANEVNTEVWINGIKINNFASYSENLEVELSEGINLIKIISKDVAGNITNLDIDPIFLDTVAPLIESINIENGDIIYLANFSLQGKSNERLQNILVNNFAASLSQDKLSFKTNIQHAIEGDQIVSIRLTDLAGNETSVQYNYKFVYKILDKNLISVGASEISSGLTVSGLPGAARPGIKIEVSSGFFNSAETSV